MSRLKINAPSEAQLVLDRVYEDVARRIRSSSTVICPIDISAAFIKVCQAQSCGKCVPCRIGLGNLVELMEEVLNGTATLRTIDLIKRTAETISLTADCAIGYGAADMVLHSIDAFRADYESHILKGRCGEIFALDVPCNTVCPANVDVPSYITLVGERRYSDAVRLIRFDNPFPCACGYVCEHPCEKRCRRNIIDAPINIRGLKRFAADNAGVVPPPDCMPDTGKKIAIVGGGPAGLTAAYYLKLMGHRVTVYERRAKLGGMLRYGIPAYRLPREKLQYDLDAIVATGIDVRLNSDVGTAIALDSLREEYDAVYISIGAHADKKIGIPGEDASGVIPAVEMLRAIGDDMPPDLTGKKVVVVGGGNVAMDAARTAVRLGASKVSVVYRRREEDMPALSEEREAAVAEGVEFVTLASPSAVESDENGSVTAFIAQPQLVSKIGRDGRPGAVKADKPELRIPCDVVIAAVGQAVETAAFHSAGIPTERGVLIPGRGHGVMVSHNVFAAKLDTAVEDMPGVFVGGECSTGPATVVRAVAAGKVAAANIDDYLGFHHVLEHDIEITTAAIREKPSIGRVNLCEREACQRKCDFNLAENGMTREEAAQEARRCLRCDHFGFGALREGDSKKW